MSAYVLARLLSCITLIGAAPIIGGATDLTSHFEDRVLAAQNRERARLGIARLAWDPALVASARKWADHLAASGAFEHAPENQQRPEGENLWAGSKGYYSIEAMVDGWVREKRFFKQGAFPDNSTTGNWEDVGHYTQLTWRQSGQVGCAKATGAREDVLVCRYSDAGNYIGEVPF